TWSQDESKMLTSSSDKTARIWDANTGEELVTLQGHTGSVWQATWSQDESKILTSSDDDTARIWDANTGEELVTLQGHTDSVNQATWSQDESKILTRSSDGTARVWYAEMKNLLVRVCDQASRNLSWEEWQRFMNEPYRTTCSSAPIPPDAISAISDQAIDLAQNGDLLAAQERLGQLVGWLHENGQFNTFGIDPAKWLAALEAGQNPWEEESKGN
ncbi:MAG: hypothetical protein AAF702_24235, partial [Chloroflexota bacterium]